MNATEKMMLDGFESNTLKLPTIHLMQMGTGKGKTYFVVHTLIPRALANGERVLVLGNRSALHLQTVQAIRKTHDDFVNVTSPMVRGYWGRGALPAVVVKTYQEVEMMISNGEDFFAVWGRFDYIVMDECHYFMQDSMFNPYTALSFETILSQRCQLYCMSATMEEFEKMLAQRLQYLHEKSSNVFDAFLHIEKHVLEDDFTNVQAICFYENSEIVNKINASPSFEKWLVFVEDKELAQELAQKIKKSASILTAEDKEGSEFKELTRHERFQSEVLIATAVIDNGVNVKDVQLRNLVLMTSEKTEFLQMLGRKRRNPDEKVTIYIKALEMELLEERISKLERLLEFGHTMLFQQNTGRVPEVAIRFRDDWRAKHFVYHYYDKQSGFTWIGVNHLAVFHCEYILNEYLEMLAKINESWDAAVQIPLSWIGKTADEVVCLDEIVTKMLDGMVGNWYSAKEYQEKINEFKPFIQEYSKNFVQNGKVSKPNFEKYLHCRHPPYVVKTRENEKRQKLYLIEKENINDE